MGGMLKTVALKPTRLCNAACDYCTSPDDGHPPWTMEDFKRYFDALVPHAAPHLRLIWYGGEPMVMGPDFYREAFAYARSRVPGVRMVMGTNLLAYNTVRWRDVLRDCFEGVWTSYEPGEAARLYQGSAVAYETRFFDRLDALLDDGFKPMVSGNYTNDNIGLVSSLYDRALAQPVERAYSIRVVYRYPTGLAAGLGEMLEPESYGAALVALYDRWIKDVPPFVVRPLEQMLNRVMGHDMDLCPYQSDCTGQVLMIEPDGMVHNCTLFSVLDDASYAFGNLNEADLATLFASKPARSLARRRFQLPATCRSCRHLSACEGGCQRDALLYGHGLDGKTHYCMAWQMVFDRIKESIRTGEADASISRYASSEPMRRLAVA